MQVHQADKTIHFKIVYYGAGLCGKTTNLNQIFQRLTPEQRRSSEIMVVPTQADKTLSFECMPLHFSKKVGIYTPSFSFYTVPGQVYYENMRRIILDNVDGVVFVADSQPEIRAENIRMFKELVANLQKDKPKNTESGNKWDYVPIVLQFNKRDIPDAMPVTEMANDLQQSGEFYFESSAINGIGVMETMQMITHLTIEKFRKKQPASSSPA